MNLEQHPVCQSCGMPMTTAEEHAPGNPHSQHCKFCSRPDGVLQEFDERFERMVQWQMRQKGSARDAAEAATRAYMKKMPLWKDHPKLAS